MHVGLTPKLLCRTLRFQQARALAEEAERRSFALPEQEHPAVIDWADIAIACGYYDQSHLINDFQKLSGLSPAEYIWRVGSVKRLKDNHLPLAQ
jgi:AraC-like DNA-binding protein